jgi:hypothetical protein
MLSTKFIELPEVINAFKTTGGIIEGTLISIPLFKNNKKIALVALFIEQEYLAPT